MSLKTDFRRLLSLWLHWKLRNPVIVLLLMAVLTFFALQYTVNNLSINTDTAELIAPDAPFQQNRRNYEKAFSQDMHTLLLVVESETPELTKSATKRLGRLLSTDKKNIQSVYIPGESDFLHKNGLLYLDAEDLQTISGNLSQAQPFIGRITQEPNLTGFFSIFQDALTSADKTQNIPTDLPALVDKVSAVLHKIINGGNGLLSWQELIAEKKLKTAMSNKGFIIVLPTFDYTQIRPAELAINSIRQSVSQIQDANLPNVKVWVTGEVGLEDDELSGMSEGTFTASIFSVVFVCVILLVAYRSIAFTIATLLTLAIGMVFCGAFAAFSVKELNLISVAFAVSNMGLGVEYAIHFCLRYRDNLSHHVDRGRAIYGTLVSTSPSLMLCAGTTAIGLYAFIPTDYKGVSELGLLAGTSLFICLLVTLIVLPALLKIIPTKVTQVQPVTDKVLVATFADKIATATLHYAKPIVMLTAVITAISIALVFKVQTDFNPINLRDPNTESVIAFKDLTKDKETTPMTLTILAKDEAKAKALQQKLATVASVDKTISLFDFIPSDQESKLQTIEDMALTLGSTQDFPALKADLDPIPGINNLIKAIDTALPTKTDAREI
jgi:hopanoid biosynthesis associated RND transporter like protein HpnN